MYPALSGSRGVSRGNTSRSPFLTARPGRFEVFQSETRAEASSGLKPLWCRSGGFIRKPEHDAHGRTRGWVRIDTILLHCFQSLTFHNSHTRRGTNAMFWRFDCDGGDEC